MEKNKSIKRKSRKSIKSRRTRSTRKTKKVQTGGWKKFRTPDSARQLKETLKYRLIHPLKKIQPFVNNYLVEIPVEVISRAFGLYLNFLNKLISHNNKKTQQRIEQSGGQREMGHAELELAKTKALEETINNPEFKQEWSEVADNIINILFRPILKKAIILAEEEADEIGGALGTMVSRITQRILNGVWDGIEAGLAVVPGVGTVLDILQIAQTVFDSVATLSIQSIRIIAKIFSDRLEIVEDMIAPLKRVDNLIATTLDGINDRLALKDNS